MCFRGAVIGAVLVTAYLGLGVKSSTTPSMHVDSIHKAPTFFLPTTLYGDSPYLEMHGEFLCTILPRFLHTWSLNGCGMSLQCIKIMTEPINLIDNFLLSLQVTESTANLLIKRGYPCEYRGRFKVKGKKEKMNLYLVGENKSMFERMISTVSTDTADVYLGWSIKHLSPDAYFPKVFI